MSALSQLGVWFMPEELLVPVVLLMVATGLTLRFVGLKRLGGSLLFGGITLALLPVLMTPIIEELIQQTPPWVVVGICAALGFYLVRLVLTLFLGKEGAGTLLAMAVAGVLRGLLLTPRWATEKLRIPFAAISGTRAFTHLRRPALVALLAALAGLVARLLGLDLPLP